MEELDELDASSLLCSMTALTVRIAQHKDENSALYKCTIATWVFVTRQLIYDATDIVSTI